MDIGICKLRLKIQPPKGTLDAISATPRTSPPDHIVDTPLPRVHENHVRRERVRGRAPSDGGLGPVVYDPEVFLYLRRTPPIHSLDNISPVCRVQIEFSTQCADIPVTPK